MIKVPLPEFDYEAFSYNKEERDGDNRKLRVLQSIYPISQIVTKFLCQKAIVSDEMDILPTADGSHAVAKKKSTAFQLALSFGSNIDGSYGPLRLLQIAARLAHNQPLSANDEALLHAFPIILHRTVGSNRSLIPECGRCFVNTMLVLADLGDSEEFTEDLTIKYCNSFDVLRKDSRKRTRSKGLDNEENEISTIAHRSATMKERLERFQSDYLVDDKVDSNLSLKKTRAINKLLHQLEYLDHSKPNVPSEFYLATDDIRVVDPQNLPVIIFLQHTARLKDLLPLERAPLGQVWCSVSNSNMNSETGRLWSDSAYLLRPAYECVLVSEAGLRIPWRAHPVDVWKQMLQRANTKCALFLAQGSLSSARASSSAAGAGHFIPVFPVVSATTRVYSQATKSSRTYCECLDLLHKQLLVLFCELASDMIACVQNQCPGIVELLLSTDLDSIVAMSHERDELVVSVCGLQEGRQDHPSDQRDDDSVTVHSIMDQREVNSGAQGSSLPSGNEEGTVVVTVHSEEEASLQPSLAPDSNVATSEQCEVVDDVPLTQQSMSLLSSDRAEAVSALAELSGGYPQSSSYFVLHPQNADEIDSNVLSDLADMSVVEGDGNPSSATLKHLLTFADASSPTFLALFSERYQAVADTKKSHNLVPESERTAFPKVLLTVLQLISMVENNNISALEATFLGIEFMYQFCFCQLLNRDMLQRGRDESLDSAIAVQYGFPAAHTLVVRAQDVVTHFCERMLAPTALDAWVQSKLLQISQNNVMEFGSAKELLDVASIGRIDNAQTKFKEAARKLRYNLRRARYAYLDALMQDWARRNGSGQPPLYVLHIFHYMNSGSDVKGKGKRICELKDDLPENFIAKCNDEADSDFQAYMKKYVNSHV